MDNTWFLDIEKNVFTILKTLAIEELKERYPNISFTTSDANKITKFPTVYVHETDGLIGKTFEKDVQSMQAKFTIECYSDKSQDENRKVLTVICKILNDELGFTCRVPINSNANGIYRMILLASREIGSDDPIIVE